MFSAKISTTASCSIVHILVVYLSLLISSGQLGTIKIKPVDNTLLIPHSANRLGKINQILKSIDHPGEIIILTDIFPEFNSGDVALFAGVSIAISLFKVYNSSSSTSLIPLLHGNSKQVLVLDFSEESLQIDTTEIDSELEGLQNGQIATGNVGFHSILNQLLQQPLQEAKWNPTILILLTPKYFTLESGQVIPLGQYNMVEQLVQNVSFSFNSNVFPIFVWEEETEFETTRAKQKLALSVWEVYNIKRRRIISLISDNLKLSVLNLEAYATRRKDFHLEKFTATVKDTANADNDWGDVRMRQDDGTYYLKQGYIGVIYSELKLLLNFSESIVIGDSPIILPNGTMSGRTMDQLRNDEADFGLSTLSLNPQRAGGLAFLHPTHHSLPYVFFKQPPPNSIRDNVTGPFKPELWIALLALWAILAISLKSRLFLIPQRGGMSSQTISKNMDKRADERFARESLLCCISALCQKSWYLDPKSFPLKMQFLLGSLTALIVYTAYSTFIVSSLAVSSIPVNSFLDLIKTDFVFTVHELSQPFHTMLQGMIKMNNLKQPVYKVSTEDEISHLFDEFLPLSIISSTAESQIREVSSSHKAFLSYADLFYKTADFQNYSSTFMCHHVSTFKIDVGFNLRKAALVIKKGAQFKEILNYMLVRLINYGLTYRNDGIYSTSNILKCPPEEQLVRVDSAEFSDVSLIVFLLLAGVLIAGFVFLSELTVHYRCKYLDNANYFIRQKLGDYLS